MQILFGLLKLIRPHQWYKNLVVYLALIFSMNLFNYNLVLTSSIGLILLIGISSANYIFNDLIDLEKDKLNPEKKSRPLASGMINPYLAIIVLVFILILTLYLAFSLGFLIFIAILSLFVLSTLYSLILKHIVFADLISIATLFVLRAVVGAIIIKVYISPWLIIGIFFFAMFLVAGKRYGEICFLKNDAQKHRKVLEDYDIELIRSILNIFLAILIMVFALYAFSSSFKYLIFTIPFFIYTVLRYYFLIMTNNDIIRKPELFYRDIQLVIGALMFAFSAISIIYLY